MHGNILNWAIESIIRAAFGKLPYFPGILASLTALAFSRKGSSEMPTILDRCKVHCLDLHKMVIIDAQVISRSPNSCHGTPPS
jgi:hypothetical protein